MPQLIKFNSPYRNLSPDTIFEVDSGKRTASPFGSAEALTERGYNFGQVQIGAPQAFGDYNLGSVINSKAGALAAVKTDLNSFQNDTFNAAAEANKRKSSSLEENIAKETEGLSTVMAEFNTLTEKYKTLALPNYQQAYTEARTSAGIPSLEADYVGVRQTRRELPYTERANTGNAGVATEGQLGAQTAQKDIPLEAREANLIDRLQLASDFVNQSLKFKELDSNTARTALENAINLVTQSVNMSRTSLGDLKADKATEQARQDVALDFNIKNNINTPAFLVGTQAYDARTLTPISLDQYQSLTGQQVGLSEKETNFGPALLTKIDAGKQEEKGLVLDLIHDFPDAGIMPTDSFVVASSKIKDSRLYQDKFYHPSPGGGAGGVTEVDSYAQAVYSGSLKLTSVPQKIRAQVAAKTEELKKNASLKYTTEFDARLDYDRDIQELSRDLQDSTVQLPPPTSIIEQLVNDYGSRVSKQEIESTVLNVFGHSQRPAPATPGLPKNITDRQETLKPR